jgi:hypothetical protein
MEWELTFVFEDETKHELTYVEQRVAPELSVQRNLTPTTGPCSCSRSGRSGRSRSPVRSCG